MKGFKGLALIAWVEIGLATRNDFNVLKHLGGSSPWFSGPELTGISSEVPSGCVIDQAAFVSRHGSRYPDQGAYNEWVNLSSRIHAAKFAVLDENLKFLSSWLPVLKHPAEEVAQISTTGYKELYDMGATYRLRYPNLYVYNTNFTLWSNYYSSSPRVRDSARLFARGFLGPNATDLGSIFAINASDPRSFMNSLAPSDLCPAYSDNSGGIQKDTWDNIYLPPIQTRLNKLIRGDFQFTQKDVNIIPYICGFETQITGFTSPWCSIFTEEEILQYEYAQDLRYWYGTGLGTDIEKYMMVPVLDGLVQRFVDGPDAMYKNSDGSAFMPPQLIAAFSNDGQINQLAAAIGVFEDESDLPAKRIPKNRLFKASNFVTMRGTICFERLLCSGQRNGNATYMRIRLNDVVYPVANCQSGPGKSCPLGQYQTLVKNKLERAGNFSHACHVTNPAVPARSNSATFFTDVKLSFETLVRP
ncbi:acid phosphatase PHO12 precursor [Lindgomyces ingoldianus]|uniref:Acid phosphatase PHO12 n=1 Tax=Lindgomyces ingoldianus TaxID=673940 RepID=A0ACB6QFF1_9PLEO|nr:acid phosphatase PHO12 precursor [Lindgomyces ingoldianus]KAF2465693.1 acid phosphatase PHO12 precursor [Lindgomyces ingoldianus]